MLLGSLILARLIVGPPMPAAPAPTLALHWIAHEDPAGAPVWGWMVLGLITALVVTIAARTVGRLLAGQFLPRAVVSAAVPAT